MADILDVIPIYKLRWSYTNEKEISGRWISEDGAAINLSEDGSFTALALPAELFLTTQPNIWE